MRIHEERYRRVIREDQRGREVGGKGEERKIMQRNK